MVLGLILPSATQDVHEKLKSHSGFTATVVSLYYGFIYFNLKIDLIYKIYSLLSYDQYVKIFFSKIIHIIKIMCLR